MKDMRKNMQVKLEKKVVDYVKMVGCNKKQKEFYMLLNEISLPDELLQQRIQG